MVKVVAQFDVGTVAKRLNVYKACWVLPQPNQSTSGIDGYQ